MRYLAALLMLGLLVAVHEFGHVLAARIFGVRVRRYAVGFGPLLLSFHRRGTLYTLGAIPFGGFAHIEGMNPHEVSANEGPSFRELSPLKRIIVLLAGTLTNYLLAILVMWALFVSGTHVAVPMTVGKVVPGSEAARAQLLPGDLVTAVNQEPVQQWSDLVDRIAQSPELEVRLDVTRGTESKVVTLNPRRDLLGMGRIGITQQYVFRPLPVGEALKRSLERTAQQTVAVLGFAGRLLRGKAEGILPERVTVVNQASTAAQSSGDAFLRALSTLSIGLGLFFLIPVPSLDGGRILFLALEAATGRRIPAWLETLTHALGFAALVVAMVLLSAGEIRRARRTSHPAPAPLQEPARGADSPDAGR